MEPVGILKAWNTKVRMNSARMTATQIDSKYSRSCDFSKVGSELAARGASMCFLPFRLTVAKPPRVLDVAVPAPPGAERSAHREVPG